ELAARDVNFACHVVSNPEFLKEGTAIADCMSPDRVVIGSSNQKTANFVKELYSPFVRESDRFIVMDVRSAEMTKYASNAMLATRISFMNEIACICEAVGADVNLVRLGMGADTRIGYSFLYAGCGYGGSCFPKDVQALVKTARDCGCVSEILTAVESVNRRQKHELAEKVIAHFGEDLSGRIFAIWGLAFKPNTDDMREAPSLTVIRELLEHGASVKTYDPKATDEAKKIFGESVAVEYCDNKYDALEEADAMLLLTEWKEFRSPDFAEMKQRMKTPLVFDGRNQYKAQSLQREGFSYWQVGVRNG
ncbi:MAG: UDP-glucose/GDP-mannose dehydrogenase family protein, partial [Firmicutes bacterium]|nr:UDP-glucose/GDP-mannose dehydrogenase family protein [Bacillota bacterium]